jgi:glycosyltransferase involved in cell wall biosynthesis
MASESAQAWIVVPCYNEAARLPAEAFLAFARSHPGLGFCFVNDGSADATGALIDDLARRGEGRVLAISLPANVGKAEAVRAGCRKLLGDGRAAWIGYWDADLATPLEEIERFMALATRRPEARFLLGARMCYLGSNVHRKLSRHYLGRVFATCASLVLGMPVYDTQCGAKLIRADLAAVIFDRPFVSRWIFDVELLARAIAAMGRQGAKGRILEIPLERWTEIGDSRVKPIHFLRAPWEMARIRMRFQRDLRAADRARREPARESQDTR